MEQDPAYRGICVVATWLFTNGQRRAALDNYICISLHKIIAQYIKCSGGKTTIWHVDFRSHRQRSAVDWYPGAD